MNNTEFRAQVAVGTVRNDDRIARSASVVCLAPMARSAQEALCVVRVACRNEGGPTLTQERGSATLEGGAGPRCRPEPESETEDRGRRREPGKRTAAERPDARARSTPIDRYPPIPI